MNGCTHKATSPEHSAVTLLIPQIPALYLLELFLAAWSPGLGPGMDEKHWSGLASPLPLAADSQAPGGAAGSNAILLLAHLASASLPCSPAAQGLRHGAPASNGGGPSTHSPHT